MTTFAIRRRSAWADEMELAAAVVRSKRVGEDMADRVRWVRSYVVEEDDGRIGTVCIYEGEDAEAIREQARRAGMPADEVTRVMQVVVMPEKTIAA